MIIIIFIIYNNNIMSEHIYNEVLDGPFKKKLEELRDIISVGGKGLSVKKYEMIQELIDSTKNYEKMNILMIINAWKIIYNYDKRHNFEYLIGKKYVSKSFLNGLKIKKATVDSENKMMIKLIAKVLTKGSIKNYSTKRNSTILQDIL